MWFCEPVFCYDEPKWPEGVPPWLAWFMAWF